jgi:hypothetical protein
LSGRVSAAISAPPKVKSGGSKPNLLKPIPTPEEKLLMLAKARNLDAKTKKINQSPS